MSNDFRVKLGGDITSDKDIEGRYSNVRFKGKQILYTDQVIQAEKTVFELIDIIVNNSNYDPEYLKNIYAIEFYQIVNKVDERLKKINKSKHG